MPPGEARDGEPAAGICWLAAGARASAERAAARQLVSNAESRKVRLQQALDWLALPDADRFGEDPLIIQKMAQARVPAPGNPPVPAYEQLSFLWGVVEEAKGVSLDSAVQHFNKRNGSRTRSLR